jgi:hypothetical protein
MLDPNCPTVDVQITLCWTRGSQLKSRVRQKKLQIYAGICRPFVVQAFMGVRRGGKGRHLPSPLAGQNIFFLREIVSFLAFFSQILCFCPPLENFPLPWKNVCGRPCKPSIHALLSKPALPNPCATCGERLFKCGEWLYFWNFKILMFFSKKLYFQTTSYISALKSIILVWKEKAEDIKAVKKNLRSQGILNTSN